MKLIRAILRPEKEEAVIESLESVGIYAITKTDVVGRGRQRGIRVGAISYDALAKVMLMLVVNDADYEKAVAAIQQAALTGHPGDGRIFVQPLSATIAIRTGRKETTLS